MSVKSVRTVRPTAMRDSAKRTAMVTGRKMTEMPDTVTLVMETQDTEMRDMRTMDTVTLVMKMPVKNRMPGRKRRKCQAA